MFRLIIKFPFQSVNDEQYVLALHTERDNPFVNAKDAMDAERDVFRHVADYTAAGASVSEYEGTLCGSVKADDDSREDLFSPLCPTKLKFNVACHQFPTWLMDLCGYATNVAVVLYAVTDAQDTPLQVRWRGYLQCNTLNMTVVNDHMACPLVAVDEIGLAKYMPFRANMPGNPAHLTLYELFSLWWNMNWKDHFAMAYYSLGLALDQAALYWQRNAGLTDDDGNRVTDLLNTLVINFERYYLDREATWQTVFEDVCRYLGVHFAIGGYAGNYSYDNYLLSSYDGDVFETYAYGLANGSVTSMMAVRYSTLGNQRKMGGNLQITYEPDKWKGVKVKSEPERPPKHDYLAKDNVREIAPATGHEGFCQVRIGQYNNDMQTGPIIDLSYWRLIYCGIVSAEDQWVEEAEYIELEPCTVSTSGRTVGNDGYFHFTDAPLGRTRPSGEDTDDIEFIAEKRGMIPVKIGDFEDISPEWPKKMKSYLMLLNNFWGRRYWLNDSYIYTDTSNPYKVASIHPFASDGSIRPNVTAWLKIDLAAYILNENITENDKIFEVDQNGNTHPDLLGLKGTVFPMLKSYHNYEDWSNNITGRLSDIGGNNVTWSYPFLTCRLRIGKWFFIYDMDNNTALWQYYNVPANAPTFRLPIVGNLEKVWQLVNMSRRVVKNYYYDEMNPKNGLTDAAFMVPISGVSIHGQPLEGKATLEIWWPTPGLNYVMSGNDRLYNNILYILINDIEITYTDEAELAGTDIKVEEKTETDPYNEMKELKEVELELSTPKVDGVFANCLLFDGGKVWHNLQGITDSDLNVMTPERYLAEAMAKVYSRPQMWVELEREFEAANYGNVANMDFRVGGLTEAPKGIFVPVVRSFDFTKGWVKWKLQELEPYVAPPLPYDAEVEYLESTGTQYIDLGDIPQYGDVFKFDFQNVSFVGSHFVFGARGTSSSGRLFISNSSTIMYCNNVISNFTPDLLRHTLQIEVINTSSNSNLVIDGVAYRSGAVTTIDSNTYIFTGGEGSVANRMRGRFFNFQQQRGSVMVHDLIPVRVGTVGYMYDRVSGLLFGNDGTGDFIVGPDKN